jgi:uncharacterized protein YndB with AHSA1/START domain
MGVSFKGQTLLRGSSGHRRKGSTKAFLDPGAVASWRPPDGMKCQIFDAREGGIFRMRFSYTDSDHNVCGKTSEHADVFSRQFLQLVPDERIVERVEFESDDPAFGRR